MTESSTGTTMRWAAAQALTVDAETAARSIGESLAEALGPKPDLLLIFFTAPLVPAAEALTSLLKQRLEPGCIAGVSASSVIGDRAEYENVAAVTAVAARLPGVEVKPFVLIPSAWGDAMSSAEEFARHTPGAEGAELVILFGDPFSLDSERVLRAFNTHAPGLRVVGGMASAGARPLSNALVLNDWVAREGGFGIALRGALRVDVIVSQGCRPIGPSLTVTRAERNIIHELDGQPALERIEQILHTIPEREREVLKNGLYVGRPAKGQASGRGDYLIRNLLGADRDHGAIAVGDLVPEREQVRLHVRDAASAVEDLELLLAPQEFDARADGALLFTCNGRGKAFFGDSDRDVGILQSALRAPVPAAGLFCAGEFGPVGEKNFLHGHTASIAIVRGKTSPVSAG